MSRLEFFLWRFACNPPIDPKIVIIKMILNVKVFHSVTHDISINGAVSALVNSAQFSRLNPSTG